jgi:hypothetical protein
MSLTYHDQTVPMTQGVLGLRAESQHDTRFGSVRPRARLEYSHDFEGGRDAIVSYADEFGTRYTVTPGGTRRNALLLGLGSDFDLGGGLRIGLDYQTRRASRGDVDQGVRLQVTQDLDAKGMPRPWFAPSTPFEPPVRFDATFTYDDNVNRARESRDILADKIFTFGAGTSRIYRINPNTRVVGNVFVTGEEFYRYTGLSRFSGGGSAELQYRTSGDFDATTFGFQVRGTGDYYDSAIRRGYKLSLALTARQSLTDRIEAFAALTGNKRWGRSAVFDMEDYGAKVNLDYSLGGPNGSLYATGEYRRGDVVSSARFSLDSIDVADVFTLDDAFPPGYFAYRFDAKTWIGTLGYNRPLGTARRPRHLVAARPVDADQPAELQRPGPVPLRRQPVLDHVPDALLKDRMNTKPLITALVLTAPLLLTACGGGSPAGDSSASNPPPPPSSRCPIRTASSSSRTRRNRRTERSRRHRVSMRRPTTATSIP